MDLMTNATSVESLDLPTPEMALKNADPNVLRLVIDASKKAGNEAYRQKRYQGPFRFPAERSSSSLRWSRVLAYGC